MPHLQGPVGELKFTIEVTRKDTGKVETFDMVGTAYLEEPAPEVVTPINKE